MIKRLASMGLSIAMLMAMSSVPASAVELKAPGTGDSAAVLSQAVTKFSVIVPTGLPISVSSTGLVSTAPNVSIINNSKAPVKVNGVSMTLKNGWDIVDYNTSFIGSAVGTKEFKMGLRSDLFDTNGNMVLTESKWQPIAGNRSLRLPYTADVAPQKDTLDGFSIANVIFVLGWAKTGVPSGDDAGPINPSDPYGATIDKTKMMTAMPRSTATSIAFRSGLPTTAAKNADNTPADIGAAGTGSVMAYETSANSYDIFSTNGGSIKAPVDCSELFYFYQELKSLDLSNFDTTDTTNMHNMLHSCKSLTDLNMSGLNTANVASLGGLFYGCSSLASVSVGNFDTFNVTNMRETFFGCSSLTSLDLKNWNLSRVSDTYNMLNGCNALGSIAVRSVEDGSIIDSSVGKPVGCTVTVPGGK